MKKIALACLLVLVAASANAGVISDIQMGMAEEGTLQTPCDAVVTAVTYNGIWIAEEPYGAYNGIWVYMGDEEPIELVPGDVVCICGEYKEYYDLSEIDIVSAGVYGSVVKTGTQDVPIPSFVTALELETDGEPWESCAITIVDGMEVVEAPSSYGEWFADALDGTSVMFDDVFYDADTVMLGDCYNYATGIYTYTYGDFKLLPFVNGIDVTECGVDTEDTTLSSVKALYR